MISTSEMPASFDRARRISVLIVLLFDIVLWLAVAFTVLVPLALLFVLPNLGWFSADLPSLAAAEWAKHSNLPLASLNIGRRLLLIVDFLAAMAPSLFILSHGRKLFAGFVKGQVFTEDAIRHLRGLGFWLIVSTLVGVVVQLFFFAIAGIREHPFDLEPLSLVYGAMTYVAAYVMEEARRIAADHAEIV
ncbi:MAG TPA: DUF2975 domain-containing protein [Rhizomicrobium sp.]|jgi:hypothetical protein|nr:DUF2975 domain-containing protein [Rhizomicrobium sp.]